MRDERFGAVPAGTDHVVLTTAAWALPPFILGMGTDHGLWTPPDLSWSAGAGCVCVLLENVEPGTSGPLTDSVCQGWWVYMTMDGPYSHRNSCSGGWQQHWELCQHSSLL